MRGPGGGPTDHLLPPNSVSDNHNQDAFRIRPERHSGVDAESPISLRGGRGRIVNLWADSETVDQP